MWETLRKIISTLTAPKSPLVISGSTLVMKQGIIKYTININDVVWFHTHIFDARYGQTRRTVRVILKSKRQRLITFRIQYDIRPVLLEIQNNYRNILITDDRGDKYKEYMKLYHKDFSELLRVK